MKKQELPKREQGVFKTVMKCYEQKQYKKGLRNADQILKKHSNHGETLAMKGLILNCLKRKKEAVEYAQKGLKANFKSHVCWHVYGLIHRSDRKYEDAIKSYTMALKWDKDNLLILKDLSLLQIQRGVYDGFQETRRRILVLKSDQRINWIAYAVGNHMCGDHQKCLHILDTFIKTLDKDKVWDYQDSEMFLYRNRIIEESGDLKGALANLKKIEADALDKQYVWQTRARIQIKLGQKAAAEAVYRKLLEVNNENKAYHTGLQESLGLSPSKDGKWTEEQTKSLCEMYDDFKAKWKYCSYAKRFPLTFTTGKAFSERVDEYMRPKLRKGVPSLFRDLKSLYGDKEKVKTIEETVKSYYENLKKDRRFSPSDEVDSETPNVFVWVLYFLASHHEFLGRPMEALKLLDEGIEHTPTAIDLHVLRARTFKHQRDFQKAYDILNYARELDLADRYLNTKCVRYAFRAGKVEDGERIVKLFLRDSDTLDSLFEMQAMWYELSYGMSQLKLGNYAKALTKLYSVEKHFEDISEDQFDFHTWCLRKTTLRAYVDMLKYQENLRGHRFFLKAASEIIKVFVTLYDKPKREEAAGAGNGEADLSKLTAKERRAIKKRQKRLAAKAKKKEEAEAKKRAELEAQKSKEASQSATASSEATKANSLKESIPDGGKYAEAQDPLGEATKMVKQMQRYAPNQVQSHLCALEVYSRKKRYLLLLQAIKRTLKLASSASPPPPEVHYHSILLGKALKEEKDIHPTVVKIINLETEDMPQIPKSSDDLAAFNDSYLKANLASLRHRTVAAKCRVLLGQGAEKAYEAIHEGKFAECAMDLGASVEAFAFVKTLKLPVDKIEAMRKTLHENFSLTPDFKEAAKELEASTEAGAKS